MEKFILYFHEINHSSLPFVGGKGANLGEMTEAGFPIPQGFCVTTHAFRAFTEMSSEMGHFFAKLEQMNPDDLNETRLIGQQIRDHLMNVPIPAAVETAIVEAWKQTGSEKAYAVRSSATAEDLPTASFAGQQETYLNVRGHVQLIDSIRRCFASLFTDRAIAYRAKNGFDHRQVFLSVVVQEMVFPDVSGIMFTADPVSGNRKVTSIDASFGLGEALVSGLVSADLYQVRNRQIIQKKISQKKIAIYSVPEGGTVTKELPLNQQQVQALSDERIVELAELGRKIEKHYGKEQDIEWCFCDGKFYIVQSRPITSLYPIPPVSDNQLHVFASMGHIQMMTETIKPFGVSIFKFVIPIANEAGGRVMADLTPLLGVRPLRKKIPQILKNMDEQMGTAIEEFLNVHGANLPSKRIPIRQAASFFRPVIKTIMKNLISSDPKKCRTIVNNIIEESVRKCRKDVLDSPGPIRISRVAENLRTLMHSDIRKVVPYWLTSIVAFHLIKKRLHQWLGDDSKNIHLLNRSLPGNVTSDLGLMIGDLADIVRKNPHLEAYLQTSTDANFYSGLDDVLDGGHDSGRQFRQLLELFMSKHGMRCPGEIDISRPRWHEVPTALVPAILSHMRTVAPGEHRMKFEQGEREAEKAAKEIIEQVRARKGRIQAKIMSHLIKVYRNLGGLREHHKYLVIQHFDIYRQAILIKAAELVQNGTLGEAADIFYLTLDELLALEKGEFNENIRELTADRKEKYEQYKKLTPPRVMTSNGEIITGRRRDVNAPQGALIGTPVSPGVVEGYAKVILKPEEAKLDSGEIMIAPFTDPGWTPLFHSAKALVMEVGGMMTHGAVIAREYGIPAVVGIDRATLRIKNGTYIRVDGSLGYVQILQEP
jgi:rifampicin phosphotransferase